jgi:hypothetical protein
VTSDETRTLYARLRDAFSKTSADDCHRLAERVRSMQIDRVLRAISAHADECGANTYKPNVKRIAEIAARADAPAQQTIPTPPFADIIRRHEPRAAGKADWEVIVRYYRNQWFRGIRSRGDDKALRDAVVSACRSVLVTECEVPPEVAATCGKAVLADEQSVNQAIGELGQAIRPTPDPF